MKLVNNDMDDDELLVSSLPPLERAESWKDKIKNGGNLLLNIVVVAFIIGSSVFAGWLIRQWQGSDFSEAETALKKMGFSDESAYLGEMSKTCPNISGTPLSCRLLFMSGRSPRISSAQPEGSHETENN